MLSIALIIVAALLPITQGLALVPSIAIIVAIGYTALNRDVWLPFLGQMAFPQGVLIDQKPADCNVQVPVNVAPLAKVVYWAAEKENESAWNAYGPNNVGVATADSQGKAVLCVKCPTEYTVGKLMQRKLPKHIHYRVLGNMFLGKVQSQLVDC